MFLRTAEPLAARRQRSGFLVAAAGFFLILYWRRRRQRLVCRDEELEAVLWYWFGSLPLEELQRKVWFSRGACRDDVDSFVRRRFGSLVSRLATGHLRFQSPRQAMAIIICLDQLARHAWRGGQKRGGGDDYESRVAEASARASEVFETAFGKQGGKWDPLVELSTAQHAFGLLCRRHVERDRASLRRTLDLVGERAEYDAAQAKVLERFKTATERRLRVALSSSSSASGRSASFEDVLQVEEVPPEQEEIADVVGDLSKGSVGDALRAWTQQECLKRGYEASFSSQGGYITAAADEICRIAIVSLSGGVDSMVIARVLSDLRNSCSLRSLAGDFASGNRKTFGVWCVHIDYGNRKESGTEAEFLRCWCQSKEIRLELLEMPEHLRRNTTCREEYESAAREIRFGLYRRLQEHEESAILLGHHRGDIEENCLSNCLRGCSVLELAGMSADDVLHGVRVARPLLTVDKSAIYSCAATLGVPYFKDTTPKWSTRGRLRDEVLPLLRDVYGTGCGRNLERVAKESDAVNKLCEAELFKPFFDNNVRRSRLGARVSCGDFRDRDVFFWRTVMRRIAHSLGLGALSDKALGVFVRKLKACGDSSWLELKRGWNAYMEQNGDFFLFASQPVVQDEDVTVGVGDAEKIFGVWTILAFYSSEGDKAALSSPQDLADLFESERFAHTILLSPEDSSLKLASKTLAKYPPFRALDDLVRKSTKLRDFVPIVAPPVFDRKNREGRLVTVTYTLNKR